MKNKKQRRKSRLRSRVAILDAFTSEDLDFWSTRSANVQGYYDRVYYDLERQRAARYDELCAALRAIPGIEVDVDRWVRVTDWRWNLAPLSAAGSLKTIGGRFNIGADLDRARGQAFPCLYLAHDVETAYREYFGAPLASRSAKLTLGEFALRRETSFTTFSVNGELDQVLDLREPSGLADFIKITSTFDLSNDTRKFARSARLPPPLPGLVIQTPRELWKRLLAPPHVWRLEPQMFAIPATSQIFGRFVRDAGFEGVLYPSQQGGATCLAVFPENFAASSARITVVGDVPPGASCTVLDKDHLCLTG